MSAGERGVRETPEDRRFKVLQDACIGLSAGGDPSDVLGLVCRGLDLAFGGVSSDIYEYDHVADELMAVWSFVPGDPGAAAAFVGTVYPLAEHAAFKRAFERGRLVAYHPDDARLSETDPDPHRQMVTGGSRSVVEAGLLFGDEVLGLLSIGGPGPSLHLDDEERELVLAFAAVAATAIRAARLERRVTERVIRDGLTGLPDRRTLLDRLGAELARGRRYGRALCLLLVDIDRFGLFNDAYGRAAGDEVLRLVARILASDLRHDVDLACRSGGGEFAVILPDTPSATLEVAERVRRKVAAASFSSAGGDAVGTVTVSVGVAAFPGAADTAEGLLAAATSALSGAKAAGGDQVMAAAARV